MYFIADLYQQKKFSRGVFKKMCPENMQQIYRRIPMAKCDFNNFIEMHFGMGVSCNFL